MDLDFETAVTELRRAWFPKDSLVWYTQDTLKTLRDNLLGDEKGYEGEDEEL